MSSEFKAPVRPVAADGQAMDRHLRWLRRYVVTSVIERVVVEAVVVGVATAVVAAVGGSRPVEIALVAVAAAAASAVLRLALAVGTGPVTHRYLLRWRDPTAMLCPVPGGPTDRLDVGTGLDFAVRLERVDAEVDPDDGRRPGLDVYRVDDDRTLLVRSDAGETTALSRLSDGRALVTADGFVPPVGALVVKRSVVDPGDDPIGVVLADHRRQRERLATMGVDGVGTEPGAVLGLVRVEWRAWEELGPVVGPLVAVGPPARFRLGLAVDVPADLVLDRTERSPARRRTRPESGVDRNGVPGAPVPRERASRSAVPADHRGAPHP